MTLRRVFMSAVRRPRALFVGMRGVFVARELARHSRLHLGCGPNILKGWANIDFLAGNGVTRWNLTDPLPVKTGTVDFVFTEHFIEHISLAQAQGLLKECHRVLRPGGIVRVSTPGLNTIAREDPSGRLSGLVRRRVAPLHALPDDERGDA